VVAHSGDRIILKPPQLVVILHLLGEGLEPVAGGGAKPALESQRK
jgi:hypothetical protein